MHRMRTSRGFTLIEVMIVVAVVAILASIAYPSYREYVIRSERTEAKTALMVAAQELERCFTQFNAYNDNGCARITGGNFNQQTVEGGRYVITAVTLTDSTFRLQAARQTPPDPRCGDFWLAHNGQRGADGANDECWRR